MALLFYFSSQPYHQQDLRPNLHRILPEQFIIDHFSGVELHYSGEIISIKHSGVDGFVEFFIRKAAHLSIYGLLGMLMYRALRKTPKARSQILWFALIICFLYAGTDEMHQYLTGERTPLFADVLLDTFGASLGMLVCRKIMTDPKLIQ